MESLLTFFTPEVYDLDLTINRQTESISGTVNVLGALAQPAQGVVKFHAVDLVIESVALLQTATAPAETFRQFRAQQPIETPCQFNCADGILTVTLPQSAPAKIALSITFHTNLNHNMQACYLSTYRHAGREERIAATQFESHYARECFPCIDEPAAKTRFDLTLRVPDLAAGDVVLANTPLIAESSGAFTFETTPRMSTYLLAWVIGKFHQVTTTNRHGVAVTSYCPLNHPVSALVFANDTAARALDYYDQKFGLRYPLPKLDQVALPDFEAGAMENWGLVTYRESMMLADAAATLDTKKSVALTVTHELSHQWFGDLVTMAWWDDLWLNESFASIMEYYCTDALYPDFDIWQNFYTGDCVAALRRDALPGVQSVKQAVHHPAEIATLFDGAIVYAKGARLILMLIRLMGPAQFDHGIQDYFLRFQYQNTIGDDLWQALQPYADFDVKAFMDAWISQPGYPEISHAVLGSAASVVETPTTPQTTPTAKTSKSPKSSKPSQSTKSAAQSAADQGINCQKRFLLGGTAAPATWPLPEVFDDMSGHYLINLDDAAFQHHLDHFLDLSLEQRLRLLIDRSLLARTPDVPAASLLGLLPKFVDETSGPVWRILASLIGDLKLFCPPESTAETHLKTYLDYLYADRFAALDLSTGTQANLDANATELRDQLLGLAVFTENSAVAARLAHLYHPDVTQIDAELRCPILITRLRAAEDATFPELLSAYQSVTDPELKNDLLYVLACFSRQPEHLDTLLDLLSNPDLVRPQDHLFLYIYLLRNHRTTERALDWLIAHWDYVVQLTGEKSLEDYPRYVAGLIRTPEEAQKFFAFFDPKAADPILKRTIEIAHTEIAARLALIAADAPAVTAELARLAATTSVAPAHVSAAPVARRNAKH